MIELSKMAWAPVLELLGKEIRFDELSSLPYPFEERVQSPVFPGIGLTGVELAGAATHEYRWLTSGDVIRVHDDMITTFGGEAGVLNRGRIDSALDLALQSPIAAHDPFPTIIEKSASLLHSILLYHPFVDGQKRTGISSAFILLGVNGFFMWSREPADEVHFAIHVARGEYEVAQIARWIAARIASPAIIETPEVVAALLPYARRQSRSCTRCHRQLRLDRYRIECPGCHADFVVVLNAALVRPGRRRDPFFVQAGLRRVDRIPSPQQTLDSYLDREGSALRLARRGQSSS